MRSAQHDGNLINHEEYFAEEVDLWKKITVMTDYTETRESKAARFGKFGPRHSQMI